MARLISSGWKSGDIRIWTKPIEDIPQGWQLCDGTNGAPDMRDRALVGAGGGYAQNQMFGTDSRTPAKPSVSVGVSNHTLSTSRIPSHNHYMTGSRGISTLSKVARGDGATYLNTMYTSSNGGSAAHNHGTSVSVGNVGAVDTRQKSIAVYWIMKL